VKVPNAALRFTPSLSADELQAVTQKSGITQTRGKESADTAVIWKLGPEKNVEPVQVKLGITDHTNTEIAQVLKGTLNPSDQVVIGSSSSGSKPQANAAAPGLGPRVGGAGRMGR
jgi:hypothetical protein